MNAAPLEVLGGPAFLLRTGTRVASHGTDFLVLTHRPSTPQGVSRIVVAFDAHSSTFVVTAYRITTRFDLCIVSHAWSVAGASLEETVFEMLNLTVPDGARLRGIQSPTVALDMSVSDE